MSKIINFLKGGNTRIFIIAAIAMVLYKVLGLLGIAAGLLFFIATDIFGLDRVKVFFQSLKSKFFIITALFAITACGTQKTNEATYSVSQMLWLSKDTIAVSKYRSMVNNSQLPPLSKFTRSYFRNEEERKANTYYVYYDSVECKLYNVKELVNGRDTAYVIERKIIK